MMEATVALGVLALLGSLSVPPLLRMSSALRVQLAAHEIASVLATARAYAIRHSANVGVKFFTADSTHVTYAMFRDGDGDGVRTVDIESGVDPRISPVRRLTRVGPGAHLGFPDKAAPRDPGDSRRRLDRLDDPIRFNRSDIASFSSLGTSTPGSIYVTDRVRELSAVRVFGRTGKIKILRYDLEGETWR